MSAETPESEDVAGLPEPVAENRPRTRRSLLELFGAVAVGLVGGAAARSETAGATNGDSLVVGQSTAATSPTTLVNSGAISNDGAFVVEANTADWAIEGSSGNLGVLGSGFVGVTGTGDIGGFFSGNLAAISLQPQPATGPPPSGEYSAGDILVDATGVMYLCVTAGNPGTWIKVSHGGTRYLDSPARAYDSRQGTDGKLRPGFGFFSDNPRLIPITSVVTAVPANAIGVIGNITVTEEDTGGFVTIWPGGPWPGTSNINFSANVNLANAFSVGLSGSGGISIAASGPTHVIIDIAGYIL